MTSSLDGETHRINPDLRNGLDNIRFKKNTSILFFRRGNIWIERKRQNIYWNQIIVNDINHSMSAIPISTELLRVQQKGYQPATW